MSTAGRPDDPAPAASDLADSCRDAEFVRLVAAADGDALAALGLLAGALDATGTPYQASVVALPVDAARSTDADLTIALGRPVAGADLAVGIDDAASATAYTAAGELATADPVLGLAGQIAAGAAGGDPLADAEAAGIDRRPGLAVPTTDVVDGLAHSTLVHGPFSGDVESAGELLADVSLGETHDEETHRKIASLVTLAVAGDEAATDRSADAVERVLRPHLGGPFETVGGYADVLDALARTKPGLGVALAVGSIDADPALAAWREHGTQAHAAVRSATTGRYNGLFVARCDEPAPVGTVARLVREYRSPEPVVLVVADGEAAALGTDETDVGTTIHEAAATIGGQGAGTRRRGRATFDADDTEFVVAFREAQ